MNGAPHLAELIFDQLRSVRGRILLCCPPSLASKLDSLDNAESSSPRQGRLVLADHSTSPRRLARLPPSLAVVRARPTALPFAPRSLQAAVLVDVLSRRAEASDTLAQLGALLQPGGVLIVAERLLRSPVLRGWRRLTIPGSRRLMPQQACALLLNEGYQQIGQTWPGGIPQRCVTRGALKVI